MSIKPFNQKGFAAAQAILLVVILAMIGGTGYFVYQANKKTDDTYNQASQVAQTSPAKKIAKKKAVAKANTPSQAQRYLEIKEWGVRLPVPANVNTEDIYYAINSTSFQPNDIAWLGSSKLKAIAASCDPGSKGSSPFGGIERLTPANYQISLQHPDDSGVSAGTKLGDYYYAWQKRPYNCAGIPNVPGAMEANVMMWGGTTSELGSTFILDNFPQDMPTLLKSIQPIK